MSRRLVILSSLALAGVGRALAQDASASHDTIATQIEVMPLLVSHPDLIYPAALRAAGVQGRVVLRLVVDTLGRPEVGSIVVTTSAHAELDSAAVVMVRQAIFAPGRSGGRPVRVLVEIPVDFTAPRVPDGPGDSVYKVGDVTTRPERISAPLPEYPEDLRAEGVEGSVLVQAIVDTTGNVERGTVHVVSSTNPGFNASAIAMVAHSVFKPARLHGRAVRVLVQLPVNYSIGR